MRIRIHVHMLSTYRYEYKVQFSSIYACNFLDVSSMRLFDKVLTRYKYLFTYIRKYLLTLERPVRNAYTGCP